MRPELGTIAHGPPRPHDPGLGVGEREQQLEPADDAPEPAARPPVDERPAGSGYGIIDGQHVRIGKLDIEIPIRMGRVGQVAVFDAAVADAE